MLRFVVKVIDLLGDSPLKGFITTSSSFIVSYFAQWLQYAGGVFSIEEGEAIRNVILFHFQVLALIITCITGALTIIGWLRKQRRLK